MSVEAIRITAHVLHLVLKAGQSSTDNVDFAGHLGGLLRKGHSHSADAGKYLRELTECRRSLLLALGTTAATTEEVHVALDNYLRLIHHLMVPVTEAPPPAPEAGPPWRQTSVCDAVSVSWSDALFESSATKGDARFEVASVLLAVGMWKAAKAASCLCRNPGEAVDNSTVSKAYQLYREAAGIIQHLLDKHLESLKDCTAGDLDSNVLSGLYKYVLAEAESLTVLRAIEKGNVPSLIAGLSMDVSQLYYEAFRCIQRTVAPTAQSFKDATGIAQDKQSGLGGWNGYCRKLGGYLSYKASCFKAYMLGYHALDRSKASQGGEAVRLSQEADKIVRTAAILGREYDNLKPQTPENDRHKFTQQLQERMSKIEMQCQKDNVVVYMQKVPDALPSLPEAKQLVSPIDYSFPPLDSSVDRALFSGFDLSRAPGQDHIVNIGSDGEHGMEGKGKASDQRAKWWRWLLAIVALPILLLITVLGAVIWLFLLPVKVFCCPVGFAAQMLWDVMEYLIKAPFLVLLWASGKPWKPQKSDVGKKEAGGMLNREQPLSS